MADGELADGFLCALGVRDGLLRDVVDPDLGGGAAGLLGVLGCDERNRLAEVAHVVHHEDRLVGELEAVALLARDVVVGEDGMDAGHAAGLGRVDALDAGRGVGAANRVAEEHAGREEVARVGKFAGDLGDRVDAANRLADPAVLQLPAGGGAHPCLPLARVFAPGARHTRASPRYARKRVVVRGGPLGLLMLLPPSAPRAAAEVAAQGLADLIFRWIRYPLQKIRRGHHQARRAEPTLHRSRRRKRLLHRMELAVRTAQPFHRHHLVSVRLRREHQACAHELAFQQDGARPALPLLARVLRPGKAHVLAQRVQEALALPDLGLPLLPIHHKRNLHVRHLLSARSTSTFNA